MNRTATEIRLLVLDVDGVLTDGSIHIDDHGHETKVFNVRDGFGMRLWQSLGFELAVITGRTGRVVQHRMAELGVKHLVQGADDKAGALAGIIEATGIPAREAACIGDDWPDIPLLNLVGYPMAVADADPRVKEVAAFVTEAPGGRGAVREAVEHLIRAKGLMDKALSTVR